MKLNRKKEIREMFGAHLKKHREEHLRIDSMRQLSFLSNLDHSKLSKIEKGKINLTFDTLMEIAITYKLKPKDLFNFPIEFWEKEADR